MTLQPDGKVLIAGTTITHNHRNIALIRYNPNGTLDTTFGTKGTTTTNLGDWDTAHTMVLQPDGKILIAGTTITHNHRNIALIRYNPNGTLDTTFGTKGTTTTNLGDWDTAHTMVLQPDGKILIAGTTITHNHRNIALIRYNPNGTLDTTFGTKGTTTTNLGDWDTAHTTTLQPDGKILIAGTRNVYFRQPKTHEVSVFPDQMDFLIARYNHDGTLDTTFGTEGTTTTDLGGWDRANTIALQPDGNILIAGTTITHNHRNIALTRYNSNGTLDTTFGTEGATITNLGDWDTAHTMVLQPDGRVLIAGTTITHNHRNIALTRYNSNGTLDTTFGTKGTTSTALGGRDFGQAVALQSPTHIIVVGTSNDDFALIRYGQWIGTFSDDDDSIHESDIETLTARGIMTGCDAMFDRYCPLDTMTRADVAVALARAIGNIPDSPTLRPFSDISDDSPYRAHVAYLADLGVTRGCDDSSPRFCPDLPATRAQVAVLLVRAFNLERVPEAVLDPGGRNELHGSGPGFTDVGDHYAARAIEALYSNGISRGCSVDPPRYCPDEPVSRGQMATMLSRLPTLRSAGPTSVVNP